MIDETFQVVELPGPIEDAGFAYGRLLRPHLTERLAAYLGDLIAIKGVTPEALGAQARAWAGRLPEAYRRQIEAMADGARVDTGDVERFLYADISVPGSGGALAVGAPIADGPMCSGVILSDRSDPWVGRNCDWYAATLRRGTAAVVHRVPHRIPCMCLGIMGDIDADTGINAERVWMHVHTLLARDEPRAGVSMISWLFWLREALETCASLADLERLLSTTDRDRGVMVFAVDGKSNEAAIFECGRSSYRRLDPDAAIDGGVLMATNHCRDKHPVIDPERPRCSRAGSTVSRMNRMRELLREAPPEHLPDDLAEILADPGVEMREAVHLRTIYSAVVNAARGEVWFASGGCPAASRGVWRRVGWPF